MSKAVSPKVWTLNAWTDGTKRSYPQPSGLSFLTAPALSPASNGGVASQLIQVTNGVPPYRHVISSPTGAMSVYLSRDGWFMGAPVANETVTFIDTVTDADLNTVSQTFSIVCDSTLRIQNPGLPPGRNTIPYLATFLAAGGTGPYTWTNPSNNLPPGLSLVSGQITGTPTTVGTYNGIVIQVTDSASHVASATFSIAINTVVTASRPAGNTGTGFFVSNGKLFHPSGYEWRMRGFNRNFVNATWPQPMMNNSGVNTARCFLQDPQSKLATYITDIGSSINNGQLAIVVGYDLPGGTFSGTLTSGSNQITGVTFPQYFSQDATLSGTGIPSGTTVSSFTGTTVTMSANATASGSITVSWGLNPTTGLTSVNTFNQRIQLWVDQFPTISSIQDKIVINIANEWGPSNSTVWRDAYISAIGALRTAGYTCPFMIDSGGSGQDELDFINYAAAVYAADPFQSIIFSYHAYGQTTDFKFPITAIVPGSTTAITFTTSGDNPWALGSGQAFVDSVLGMTQINGLTMTKGANSTGSAPSITAHFNLNSSTFSPYVSGGFVWDFNHYALKIPRLLAAIPTGAAFVMGEFGPGRHLNPSPTWCTPEDIIGTCEANGIGWMFWSWDTNNLAGGASDNNAFCTTYQGPGIYNVPADLTWNGLTTLWNPVTGIEVLGGG